MPRILKIDGQRVYDCDQHYHLHIHEPWWGAWQRFGWEKDTPGIGINEKLLDKAEKDKRWIKLSYYKNRKFKYLITPKRYKKVAEEKGGEYTARNKTRLLVIPVTELDKMPIDTNDAD